VERIAFQPANHARSTESDLAGKKNNDKAPLTRRNLLLAAAGIAGAGATVALIQNVTPAVPRRHLPKMAPPAERQSAALALPRPMEEEPLPSDIHVRVAPVADRLGTEPVPAPKLAQQTAPRPDAGPPPVSPPARSAPGGGTPAWLRNALPFAETGGRPAIAIVIDDLGLDAKRTRWAIGLHGAVTLAFMTYAPNLSDWTGAARQARHELLVHMPMQPLSPKIDPGPNALTVSLSDAEILDRVRWGLARMDGYVGVNNHMGSRFTEDRAGMSVVMAEVETRGLLFLDSRTTADSICAPTAASFHLPFAERNVFLDDELTVPGVTRQIAALERVARQHRSAIAIGHPHDVTLSVLAEWLSSAEARGFAIVPLTSVMRRSGANA